MAGNFESTQSESVQVVSLKDWLSICKVMKNLDLANSPGLR